PITSPDSADAHQLVRLETEAPTGMRQAVAHRELGVAGPVRPVHRLEEPVPEVEVFEALGREALLGEHQLQLIAASQHQLHSRLGADAYPIDTGWRRQRAGR